METTTRHDNSPGRDPAATYRDRAATFRAKREIEERRYRVLSVARVLVFFASAGLVLVSLWRGLTPTHPEVILGIGGFLLFAGLVRRHNRIEDRMRWFGALAGVNEEAGHRVAREWAALEIPACPARIASTLTRTTSICSAARR